MDIFDRLPGFRTKTEAEEFCRRMREIAYKCDIVSVNDILKDRGLEKTMDGYHCGYDRKAIRKLKPEKDGNTWQVRLPAPARFVRDIHGYWTTENVQEPQKTDSGGGG